MSQINVNVVAPLGFTGVEVGNNNYVQLFDNSGSRVFQSSAGLNNVFIGGSNPMADIVAGVFVGRFAGAAISYNGAGPAVAVGNGALENSSWTGANTAVGAYALQDCTGILGIYNTAVGSAAGTNITDGNNNTIVGQGAAIALTTGNNNIVIGSNSQVSTATTSNSITLGNSSNNVLRCAVTSITSLSDARDKKEVEDLNVGLDFIDGLRPVKFVWDDRDENGKHDVADFGFIAQDLKAAEDAVDMADVLKLVYDENPEKLEASYGKLIPILVKAVQELAAEIKLLKNK
jgi:trimeric autotransporter adhesin